MRADVKNLYTGQSLFVVPVHFAGYTIFVWIHTIPALYSLYFFSWAITSVAEVLYFRHSFRQLEFQS